MLSSDESSRQFDVYVIALDREVERKARITEHLTRLGFGFCFAEAVDAAAPGETNLYLRYDDKRSITALGRSLVAAEIACFLSHRGVWEAICRTGRPGLILESDMMLSGSARSGLSAALDVPGWEHLMVHYNHCSPSLWGRRRLTPEFSLVKFSERRVYSAGAYLLRPAAAEKLLRCSDSFYLPVDDFLSGGWLDKDVDLYALYPRAASHGPEADASTIGSERVAVKRKLSHRNKDNSRLARKIELSLRKQIRRVRRPAKGL